MAHDFPYSLVFGLMATPGCRFKRRAMASRGVGDAGDYRRPQNKSRLSCLRQPALFLYWFEGAPIAALAGTQIAL